MMEGLEHQAVGTGLHGAALEGAVPCTLLRLRFMRASRTGLRTALTSLGHPVEMEILVQLIWGRA